VLVLFSCVQLLILGDAKVNEIQQTDHKGDDNLTIEKLLTFAKRKKKSLNYLKSIREFKKNDISRNSILLYYCEWRETARNGYFLRNIIIFV